MKSTHYIIIFLLTFYNGYIREFDDNKLIYYTNFEEQFFRGYLDYCYWGAFPGEIVPMQFDR